MSRDDIPSIQEIAELTARLRALSAAGHTSDPAERAAFLADKEALISRMEDADRASDPIRTDSGLTAAEAEVAGRAAAGSYAMVGPSARTWSVDPGTGLPERPVPDAEHRLVRDLIAREWLDGDEPIWMPCTDGSDEIVARVVPFREDVDDPLTEADNALPDQAAEPATDGGPSACPAVAHAHEALRWIDEPTLSHHHAVDDARADELMTQHRHDDHTDASSADDSAGWSW